MSITEFAPPRLTRLELQGFKSFANRTVFVFDPGITAIIGPNGSGKSNISDGVRWVLGETSHSLLRSRKTEDVIFAGGNGRSPAGMAEVTVTFDNSTGWLPIEFTEVSISRRAFRSGENQFLINGRKARLKDVHQLTASLGHSYTVVGQGLVDAALSQRPEERRGLFEHAADLTGLQLKVTEAERNLAEAETNAERINDLLSDVEPRLRTLERAAKQAREWQGVHDRLRQLEQGYYRQALETMLGTLQAAERQAELDDQAAGRARDLVAGLVDEQRAARIAVEESRAVLDRQLAHLETVVDQFRRIGHERDIASERLLALERRRSDMADTQQGLEDQVTAVTVELERVEAVLAAAVQERSTTEQNVAELKRQLTRARDAYAARERQIATLNAGSQSIERQLADAHRRWSLLEQRRETGLAERERASSSKKERARKIADLRTELEDLESADAAGQAEQERLQQSLSDVIQRMADLADRVEAVASRVATLSQDRDEARARLQAFQRIHESGAGLFAGVRAVLEAERNDRLSGIRGTLAELLTVPERFDTAIEVALGSHLQDIVVERWVDAEQAIDYLKSTKGGRATFQPIDAVRAPRIATVADEVLRRKGVHGVAAELVETGADLVAIVRSLIGRTLVVDDLDVARAVLGQMPPGWTTVTLTGEIVRTGGSVTGGSAVRESGMLSRERELRELPEHIEKTEALISAARQEQQGLAPEQARLADERRSLEAALAGLQATRKERVAQIVRVTSWLKGLEQEEAAASERSAQIQDAATSSEAEMTAIEEEIARFQQSLEQAQQSREGLAEKATAEAEQLRAIESRLAAEERQLAGLEERVRSTERQQTGLLAQQRGLQQELGTRSDRSSAIAGEIEAISTQAGRLAVEWDRLEIERAKLEGDVAPLRDQLASAEKSLVQLEQTLEAERQRLLEAERKKAGSELSLERVRGEMAALRQRIFDDLEMEEPADLLTMEVQLEEDFEEAGREISRLRERLKRVGYIGEEAVQEFEREAERHHFLRTQLEDVEGASSSLRTLLAELRQTMQQRFDETFERVAEAFAESFTQLFGGGTARLVLVQSENGGVSGVDIVAQPPGKRLQSLALLSGGERALTAAALLFAILKVNPTPFVLLDEVDAALDEANIVRFRERLQELARETQAVIITHNRGTIEVADSLYGVSMRDDGVSTVLSLRMQEAAAAV